MTKIPIFCHLGSSTHTYRIPQRARSLVHYCTEYKYDLRLGRLFIGAHKVDLVLSRRLKNDACLKCLKLPFKKQILFQLAVFLVWRSLAVLLKCAHDSKNKIAVRRSVAK
jgi:hypothetical protein